MKKNTFLLFAFLQCFFFGANAQQKKVIQKTNADSVAISVDAFVPCATTEYQAYLKKKNPNLENQTQFENWMANKIESAKLTRNAQEINSPIVNLPIVFHILSNGDPVGTNENIPDDRILSQLQVLNEDFRRMAGTPGFSNNAVSADIEIQFCMAQRNPDGGASNGIDRITVANASFDSFEAMDLIKSQTIWDPAQYINVWVANFGGQMAPIGGFAYFPQGSGLDGLDGLGSTATALNDGLMMNYYAIGSVANNPGSGAYITNHDRGRSATHEMGHFFGLRHISGDSNNCSSTDYCNDTPVVAGLHGTCVTGDSCPTQPGTDMIENHMDYTPDTCKNIYTNDQKTRMRTTLDNALRRASLKTSTACSYPFLRDGGIKLGTLGVGCGKTIYPVVTLTNRGSTTITTATFSYTVDNSDGLSVYEWTGLLAMNQEVTINFPSVTLAPGMHSYAVQLFGVNGPMDDYYGNDFKSQTFEIGTNYNITQANFALQCDNFGNETIWDLKNSAGTIVYSGGPYSETTSLPAVINQTWNLSTNQCYTFTINDSFGDGICCSEGSGFYTIKTTAGAMIAQGSSFGFSETKKWGVNFTMGVEENTALSGLKLYPNPTRDNITVAITGQDMPESYSVYTMLGQLIASKEIKTEADLILKTSDYSNGMYFIKLVKGNNSKTLRFVKE